MADRWGNSGNNGWLYFSGLQNHCRWWLQWWNIKTLTPWTMMLRRQPSSKTFLLGSFLSTIGSRWLLLFPSYAKTLLNATGLLSRRRMAKHQMWISCSKWGLPRSCYFWESSSLAPWISLERRSHVLLQLLLDPDPPGTCTVFLKYVKIVSWDALQLIVQSQFV